MNKYLLGASFAALGAGIAVAVSYVTLWNHTESIPVGLYVRNLEPIQVGSTIAFEAPAVAREYAKVRWGRGDAATFIKTLAAGPGDEICLAKTQTGEWLLINDKAVFPVKEVDRYNNPLPHWLKDECRTLGASEWLPMGMHPDSFDGRYYGPIREENLTGPYSPMMVWK